MATTKRINYIDAMRGFTMTLVVFAHVLSSTFDIRETFLSELFITFRMPMFFFISGFIAYKAVELWTGKLYYSMLLKKLKVQIIPATVFYCLYCFYLGHNPIWHFLSNGFLGYWFTFTLLGMFLIYFTASWLAHIAKCNWLQDTILIIASLLGLLIVVYIKKYHPDLDILLKHYCIKYLCVYMQFFTLGVLVRKYFDTVQRWLRGNILITLSLIVFVACLYLTFHPKCVAVVPYVIHEINLTLLVRYSSLIIVFAFFFKNSSFFDREDNKLVKIMLYIGKRTLDIYLIHFFFIPDLTFLRDFYIKNDIFTIWLFVAIAVTVLVMALTLAVSNIIRLSDFLGHHLLGVKKKK